jgi:hypothetical protein
MKTFWHTRALGRKGFTLAALLLVLATVAPAQINLTLSPAATSNTYSGPITLQITGLTNSETVKVLTYLDLNGNGVVDASDPLIDAFNLTNNGAETIGGITNISVPFDHTSTPNSITSTLSFALQLENMVGQKIYTVVNNPSSGAVLAMALLAVTNTPTGQSVSGVVYSNGIAPLPYAFVVAITALNQKYVGGTIADASGHYSLNLNPGSYLLQPALPGFYSDQKLLPVLTLTNGMSATNNLFMTNATVSIAGTVDNAKNSNTLGGVFLQAQSGSLFGVAFTDTNGNFTLGVTSNSWKIKVSAERLSRRGYLTPQGSALTVNTAAGSVTGTKIGLYKGNALFYGQFTISNAPVPNAAMECNDDGQLLSGKCYTDTNGNYAVAALVNTNVLGTNATWYCSPNPGDETGIAADALSNYVFSQIDNVGLTNSEAVLQNFIGLPISATISGQLVNNLGVPLSSISVGANATIDGSQFVSDFVNTDTNGNFSFGVASGQWYVSANCCGSDGLDNAGYYDPNNFHVVTIPTNHPVVDLVAYPANEPVLGQPFYVTPARFGFELYGASGNNYTIQASTNLESANWFTLTVVSNLVNPYFFEDFQATNSARFYRVFLGP